MPYGFIIESRGVPRRKALDVDQDDAVQPIPLSKDGDARWVKKAGRFYLGYKLHASSDKEGYIETVHKAVRGKPLTTAQQQANRVIKAKRWVIEQSFGTLKRRFRFCKANYFGREKVLGQSYLKAMCLNLLKASNKVCYV